MVRVGGGEAVVEREAWDVADRVEVMDWVAEALR